MNTLIYALGGGWGHLTRAVALARALHPQPCQILANSPYIGVVQAAMPELVIETKLNLETPPDTLVIDTFPRGLIGELATILPKFPGRKILIHRDLNPKYIAWAGNLREFVAEQYDLILCPGERGPFANLPQACLTAPWLVRAPVEISSPSPVVVCASGNQDELPWYGQVCALLADQVDLCCLAPELPQGCPPHLWRRRWPAIDWIAAARVVIGSAGYNTVNECLATGTPLIAHPWPRKYDRQLHRAKQHSHVTIVDSPQEAANKALGKLNEPEPIRPLFKNGVPSAF